MMAMGALCSAPALTANPEPLDAEFLDYLANCEGKSDNWTVVVDDKQRRKLAAKSPPKESPPSRDAVKAPERKP